MSSNAVHEDSVLISLSTAAPDDITFPERRILLTEPKPRLHIGRSSNRTTLGLLPALVNGWIDSPVMSRHHAEIEADFHKQASNALDIVSQRVVNTSQVVKIRDAGSMHGTFLNNEKVGSNESRQLVAGDKITFGMPVYRNQTVFKPATMTVGLEFRNAALANSSPSRVFTVPDDCSTDESFDYHELIDDDFPIDASITLGQQNTSQEDEQNKLLGVAIRQLDGAVEINSNSVPNDLISISSDDDDDDDGVHHGDDDESISLTDDEEMSSVPASPIESANLDDTVKMDDDATRSPSWNRIHSDTESEHMDEDSTSNQLFSDNEQGIFLYDSDDSEDMDEMDELEVDDDDPIDTDFDSSTQPNHLPIEPLPILPSLSTAVFCQPNPPEMMPFGYQLPPVGWPLHRQPSPSDAVLPLSHRHYGSEDDGAMAAANLGHKWGKPEFFEARTISRLTEPKPSAEASLVPDATAKTNNVVAEDNSLRGESKDSEDRIASSATEAGHAIVPEPVQGASRAAESEQNASRPVDNHAPEGPQVSKLTGSPCELVLPKLHFPQVPVKEQATKSVAQAPDWTPASAYELHQHNLQNLVRKVQELETCDKPMDDAIATNNSVGQLEQGAKGKRKAADISETTEHELAWHDNGDSIPPLSFSSPATPEPNISLPSPPTTPQNGDRADAQPSRKIRKIAERVGYAALGGATVGAMVFTSLIYTAPSFA